MAEQTKVVFYSGLGSEFSQLSDSQIDEDGIYFLSDTQEIYKGKTRFGMGTKPVATTAAAGIVKPASADFTIAADGTLALYQKISILSFEVKSTPRIGETISSVQLAWSCSRTPGKLTVNGTSVTASQTQTNFTFKPSSGSWSEDSVITLVATDDKGNTATATAKLDFVSHFFSSAQAKDYSIGSSLFTTFADTAVTDDIGTLSVDTGTNKFAYVAIPINYSSSPHIFVNGFEGGFELVYSSLRDSNSVLYNVYRSTQSNIGTLFVEVKR